MNSQQLWLPVQDLHKIKPVSIPTLGRAAHEPLPQDEGLLMASGEGDSVIFKGVAPGGSTTRQWMVLHS